MDDHDDLPDSPVTGSSATPEVVAALVSNHRAFLAFVERRVGSRAIAEDILQDAFVRGLDRLEHIENKESAVAWFYRVLRNAIIAHHRRNASASRGFTAFAAELEQQSEPDADMQGAICRCVGQLAVTLKPEYADGLRRIEIDGARGEGLCRRGWHLERERSRPGVPGTRGAAQAGRALVRDVR